MSKPSKQSTTMLIATRTLLCALAVAASVSGCASKSAPPPNDTLIPTPHAARVADYLTGSFSSTAQANADPDNYFDIHLHAVPIWTDKNQQSNTSTKSDTVTTWLYVEQAAASSLGRPYRQRIYRVSPVTDTALRSQGYHVQSEVFTFNDPIRFAGAWKTPSRLNTLSISNLEPRPGCTVYLKQHTPLTTYTGSTLGQGCESTLAGATYATSEVTIEPNRIIAWDKGLDENHNQVWGPTTGPYIFERVNNNEHNSPDERRVVRVPNPPAPATIPVERLLVPL